ncbi:MAG: VapC toxin family PIN domain ribonuclease [Gallionella sp.]|nr:VapC toxin family PIN domain ribonuclease [Gallionella sp.]
MRALLDVNILIALLDGNHVHHTLVTDWLNKNIAAGWASCPITENGCIRILSQPNYPNTVPAAQVAARLAEAAQHPSHAFWADSISLLNLAGLRWDNILSSRHLTDVYLLALAVQQGGCFVTLDRGISLAAVAGALPEHLIVITP